jgi:tRNA(fMet)-specific endonuclease VapC
MAALVDSSVLIAAERGLLDIGSMAKEHGQLELAMSVVSASELLHGVQRANTKALDASRSLCRGNSRNIPGPGV